MIFVPILLLNMLIAMMGELNSWVEIKKLVLDLDKIDQKDTTENQKPH